MVFDNGWKTLLKYKKLFQWQWLKNDIEIQNTVARTIGNGFRNVLYSPGVYLFRQKVFGLRQYKETDASYNGHISRTIAYAMLWTGLLIVARKNLA